MQMLSGQEIIMDNLTNHEPLSLFHRKVLIAQNPVAAALFFDCIIGQFVQLILKYGNEHPGLFGRAVVY